MDLKHFCPKLLGIIIFSISVLLGSDDLDIADSIYKARIERDEWGVPHIYGKRDADVTFGLAYAHAQDDYETLRDVIFALRGQLASIYGRDAAINDYYVHLMNFWSTKFTFDVIKGLLIRVNVSASRSTFDRHIANCHPFFH